MDLEDFAEPEVAVAAAATAAVLSPTVRNFLRKGAVYGVTGVLMAGSTLAAVRRGAARGFQSTLEEQGQHPDQHPAKDQS